MAMALAPTASAGSIDSCSMQERTASNFRPPGQMQMSPKGLTMPHSLRTTMLLFLEKGAADVLCTWVPL